MSVKSKPSSSKLFTLRFRAKIILGFVAVLAILAVSMAFAYFGFERIAGAVASYRASVAEADLARTIDRELIGYQGLTRAYTLTGAADDETAAKAAEENLKAAIAKSMSATTGAARREQVGKLEAEFQRFAKVFGEIITLTRENNKIATDELNSVGNKIRFKFDDLADTAALAGLASVQTTAKDITSQYLAVSTSVSAFVAKPEPKTADGVVARIKFLETLLVSIYANDQKITDRVTEIGGLLKQYRTSFAKLSDNVKIIVKSNGEMTKTAASILKLSGELRSDLSADQQRIEASANADDRGNRAADADAGAGWSCHRCRAGPDARQWHLAADDCDVQGDARACLGQFRRRAAGPRPQGRDRRDGRRGRGVQGSGRRQGRARCRRQRSPEQGAGSKPPRRADPLCR